MLCVCECVFGNPGFLAQVYVVVGIAAVAFTGFLLMLVILKFGGNSKFGIKGKTLCHLSAALAAIILWGKMSGAGGKNQ